MRPHDAVQTLVVHRRLSFTPEHAVEDRRHPPVSIRRPLLYDVVNKRYVECILCFCALLLSAALLRLIQY